ncbi:transposable element Tcb2 transposase [Trichonephila clavipes]|nr:transposable element Tcb2 transposase [Trichonephila clavipes]
MTAQRYVHDILQPHVLPLKQHLPGLTRQVSQDCLHTVNTFPWPARSPDLSPINHIWDKLGLREKVTTNERSTILGQSTINVNTLLIPPNSSAVQLAILNDTRYTQSVTNLRIEKAEESQLGAHQLGRLCAHEPIADVVVDGLSSGGSCIKAPLHAIHGAADVDELMIRHQYTCSSRQTGSQLPGESCVVLHRHVDQVLITAC